jgi:hypothetical protein
MIKQFVADEDEQVKTIRMTLAPAINESLEFIMEQTGDYNLAFAKTISALLMSAADAASSQIAGDFGKRRQEAYDRLLMALMNEYNKELMR